MLHALRHFEDIDKNIRHWFILEILQVLLSLADINFMIVFSPYNASFTIERQSRPPLFLRVPALDKIEIISLLFAEFKPMTLS